MSEPLRHHMGSDAAGMNRARSCEHRGDAMAFVDNTIEVAADIRKVYDAWTAFEDFPEFMEVVERIDLVADDRLHWVAVVEDDVIEWDADIIEHVPDQSVSWQALDGRETGKVTFEKIDSDETKVHYQLEYDPKAWAVSYTHLR